MSKESLSRAVELVGGQVALASAIRRINPDCNVQQGHVWKWLNALKGETPPPEYVIPIAIATSWRETPHELRADIYPHPQDGMPRITEAACDCTQPQQQEAA